MFKPLNGDPESVCFEKHPLNSAGIELYMHILTPKRKHMYTYTSDPREELNRFIISRFSICDSAK